MLFCTGRSATFCQKLAGMKNPWLKSKHRHEASFSISHPHVQWMCASGGPHDCMCAHLVDHWMCAPSGPLDVCICITTTCKHPRAHRKRYISNLVVIRMQRHLVDHRISLTPYAPKLAETKWRKQNGAAQCRETERFVRCLTDDEGFCLDHRMCKSPVYTLSTHIAA